MRAIVIVPVLIGFSRCPFLMPHFQPMDHSGSTGAADLRRDNGPSGSLKSCIGQPGLNLLPAQARITIYPAALAVLAVFANLRHDLTNASLGEVGN